MRIYLQVVNRLVARQINIQIVKSYTYLGITIDNNLNFHEYLNKLCKKLASVNGILYSIKHFLPNKTKRSIYYALAYSYINQYILVWGGLPKTNISQIQVQQNNIIRNIAPKNLEYSNTKDLYKKINILNINQIYSYQLCIFAFQWTHNMYDVFEYTVNNATNISAHSTRNSNNLRLPFPRLNKQKQFVLYNAIQIFNKLPPVIKNVQKINTFKKLCLIHVKKEIEQTIPNEIKLHVILYSSLSQCPLTIPNPNSKS